MDRNHADSDATLHPIMSGPGWQQAHTQARVIVRLPEHGKVGVVGADAAAEEQGMPRRQMYRVLLNVCRNRSFA